MSGKKDLLSLDDDDINPFQDDSYVPKVAPSMVPYEPEIDDVPLQATENVSKSIETSSVSGKPSVFSKLSPYFQIDETVLRQKIVTALRLGKLSCLADEESQNNAQLDLYSTVWITATVAMVLFFSYSGKTVIESLITNSFNKVTDFQTMINCMLLFYIYVIGVPLLLYLICRFSLQEAFDVITAIDTYGVSNTVWIPIGLISVLTGLTRHLENIIEWILVLIGGGYSGAIIYTQMKGTISELQNGRILLLGVLFLHAVFTFLVRWIIL